MNFIPNTQNIFNFTDFTLLTENVSNKNLFDFYNDYQEYASLNLNPSSFCVFPENLTTLATKYMELKNPCVVINFPHADDDFDKISNDLIIANQHNAEIDLVFPSVEFLKDTEESLAHTLQLLAFYKAEIDKHSFSVVKVIFDTTYYVKTDKRGDTSLNVNMLSEALDLVYKNLYSEDYKLFFKTSTGKVFQGEDHTRSVKLFDAFIKNLGSHGSIFNKNLGIKVSGSVSNERIVRHYLNSLTDAKHYVENGLFRVGASGLLGNLQPLSDKSNDSAY